MLEKWERKDILTVVQIVVTVFSIGISAWLILSQMKQGNVVVWRAALESVATEYLKIEIAEPAAACIYQYRIKVVDDDCTTVLRKPSNLRKAVLYVEEALNFFGEVKEFSTRHDKGYVNEHVDWMKTVTELDITSCYLYTNKIDAKKAFEEYGMTTTDAKIKDGYLRFKKRVGLRGR
jgi:hypothetical protein